MNDFTTSPHQHAEDSYVPAWLTEATARARFEVIDTRSAQAGWMRGPSTSPCATSPCLGDVAAFLSGGRARFGTHLLDAGLGVGFCVPTRGESAGDRAGEYEANQQAPIVSCRQAASDVSSSPDSVSKAAESRRASPARLLWCR